MRSLSYPDFQQHRDRFDHLVARDDEVAALCSSSAWQIAAHEGLHEGAGRGRELIWLDPSYAFLASLHDNGCYFPLEQGWLFGCQLIGDPANKLDWFIQRAAEEGLSPFAVAFGGIKVGGKLEAQLRDRRREWIQYQEFDGTDCMIVDLRDGVEAWLARRSKKFRRSIRGCLAIEGIEIEDARDEEPEHLIERILAIQRQTYKWKQGDDIFQQEQFSRFYIHLITSLSRSGKLRALFAVRDGKDLAHITGGVFENTYRGLQMSYIEEAKPLSLGNRLQVESMGQCWSEKITHYDLGMHSTYKDRWADHRERYRIILVQFF
ncbi:MAG: GNAT family N-acetyltransferase [Verrucomicrobiota bacterium]